MALWRIKERGYIITRAGVLRAYLGARVGLQLRRNCDFAILTLHINNILRVDFVVFSVIKKRKNIDKIKIFCGFSIDKNNIM